MLYFFYHAAHNTFSNISFVSCWMYEIKITLLLPLTQQVHNFANILVLVIVWLRGEICQGHF